MQSFDELSATNPDEDVSYVSFATTFHWNRWYLTVVYGHYVHMPNGRVTVTHSVWLSI